MFYLYIRIKTYKDMDYYIKITGGGSREDISKALTLISKAILTEAVENIDGSDWNDCTLTTELHEQ
jgi:hypothetical protein